MSRTPETQRDAYKRYSDSGEKLTMRRKVAIELMQADNGLTGEEAAQLFPESKATSVQPRLTYLVRAGGARRQGRRKNEASGEPAMVHYITEKGEKFARGEVSLPEEPPKMIDRKNKVVDIARKYCRGDVDKAMLELAVDLLEDHEERMKPDGD